MSIDELIDELDTIIAAETSDERLVALNNARNQLDIARQSDTAKP